jgi:hypothetical protein
MWQPSPEEWWATLSDRDRAAFMDAAPRGIIGYDLWHKLGEARILDRARTAEDQPWEYRMPGLYLAYIRHRADERGNRVV